MEDEEEAMLKGWSKVMMCSYSYMVSVIVVGVGLVAEEVLGEGAAVVVVDEKAVVVVGVGVVAADVDVDANVDVDESGVVGTDGGSVPLFIFLSTAETATACVRVDCWLVARRGKCFRD